MKNTIEVYTLPEFWASALVNGDYSGIDETEANEISSFLKENNLSATMCSCSEESFFQWGNDANDLGANCLEYSFLIPASSC